MLFLEKITKSNNTFYNYMTNNDQNKSRQCIYKINMDKTRN